VTPESQRLAIRGNGGQGTNGVKVSKPTCRTNPCGPLVRMLPDPCHPSPDTAREVQRKRSMFQSGGVVAVAGTILGDDTGVSRHRGSGPMPSEASMHHGRWGHRPVRRHPCPAPRAVRVSPRPSEARPFRRHPCPAPRAVRVSARKSEARPVRGHPCPHLNQVSARPSEASIHHGPSEHRPVPGNPCPAPRAVRVSARPSEASLHQTHGFGAHAKSGCLVGRQSALVARCVCLVNTTP